MIKKNRLSVAVSAALGLASLSLSSPGAFAQEETMLEEVVVTGSRITRNPESYLGGMSITSGEQIEQIGTYSVLDTLARLPSVTSSGGGTNRNNSNGGRGANFVEIHNLAAERTLVLMDGRRVVSTIRDSTGLAVDLQSFPSNMIDRVEVLADGASAIYGSDAVAGVVNVVMKNGFEGFEFTGGYGQPQDDGGETQNVGFLFGAQGARGGFTVGFTYNDTENVDFLDRSWSRVPILGEADDGEGGRLTLIGSGIPPEGRVPDAGIIFKDDPATGASYQPYDTFGFSGLNGSAGDGSVQSILDTGHRFNYNDPGRKGVSLVNPATVYNFGTIGEVEIADGWSAYTNLIAQHREGTLYFTPLPVSGAAGRFTDLLKVPFDNPNLPTDAAAVIREALGPDAETFQMSYRGLDLGNRTFEYDTDTYQATVGFRGDLDFIGSDWSFDSWATWGQSRLTEVTFGQLNVANLQAAVDPAQCALISSCPKKANGDPLFDPFGRSPKTQEEIDFITFEDHEKTEYEMWHVAASLATSDLIELPAGGMGFAAGLEWRDESGSVTPSGIVGNGDSGGNFAEPTSGGYNLWEIYAEVDIPILSGAPFAEELGIEAAVRYSDYDDYDETTWKLGGRWAPAEWLTFRAQASTGFRAPNVLELFGGTADAFTGVTDPCNAVNQAANPTVAANCASQGVPADYIQPAAQLKLSQGGNPELEPETSDNFSVGLVLTPEIWGNPRIAIDYYDVEIDGAIGTPVASNVINTCYETAGLAAPECDRIGRGPNGDVIRFDLLLENLATIETSGVDVNMTFSWDAGPGVLTADWLVNWLDEYTETTDTGFKEEFAGEVACDVCSFAGYPEIKSTLSATYAMNAWTGTLAWRYIDEMDISDEIGFDEFNKTADAVNYFDFYGSYNWDNWTFSVGVENLTDEEPPFVPAISANTSPIYDYLGRFYSARIKFAM
ncbi:TonB-dependent receptor [Pseudohalioglobus sediminis]|uniref:TonB-dependent receptor n=1 Tax=Pseudohalioglobus sediminis TaxID=2606449 RepID=A0A5B0WU83_9GAMM|nr:TonB-dependent receptor [Pseudohalioglobus sediminis]KAA1190640.1 TonB-dependent receptor [Pseudohalioglobus sediminis]